MHDKYLVLTYIRPKDEKSNMELSPIVGIEIPVSAVSVRGTLCSLKETLVYYKDVMHYITAHPHYAPVIFDGVNYDGSFSQIMKEAYHKGDHLKGMFLFYPYRTDNLEHKGKGEWDYYGHE